MRYPAILLVTLALAACKATPDTHSQSQAATSTGTPGPDMQKAEEYLLNSAAADFHAHRRPEPQQFRDVRIGHLAAPDGQPQYRVCGQFLSEPNGGTPEWIPFVTIKTSGYEQYVGSGAVGYCQGSSFAWDGTDDLSSTLQSRLASLR